VCIVLVVGTVEMIINDDDDDDFVLTMGLVHRLLPPSSPLLLLCFSIYAVQIN